MISVQSANGFVQAKSRFIIDVGFYNRLHVSENSPHSNAQTEEQELEAEYMLQDDPKLGDEFFMCLPPSIPGLNMHRKEWG